MQKRLVVCLSFLLLVFLSIAAAGQEPNKPTEATAVEKKFSSFGQLEREVDKLITAKKLKEAIALFESAREQYPDNLADVLVSLTSLYQKTKNYEKAIDLYCYGIENKIFFRIGKKIWAKTPPEKTEQFQKAIKRNKFLRAQAQSRAKAKYEVITPHGYSSDKSYPLLIVLHKSNGTIERAKRFWKSETLGQEYLVAFFQSSRVQTSAGFGWMRSGDRQSEIEGLYEKVVAEYPVDAKRVYIGGFSAGGAMMMNVALRSDSIPIKGFIGVCPSRSRAYEKQEVEKAVKKNIRGVIVTGEKDKSMKGQKKVIAGFDEADLQHEFIIIPAMGHMFPDDFSKQIDTALSYLTST